MRVNRNLLSLVVAATATAVAALLLGWPGQEGRSGPGPGGPAGGSGLKPVPSGLVLTDPGKLDEPRFAMVDDVVITPAWSELEPADDQFDWSAIDRVLAAHPDVAVIIRGPYAGRSAPRWLNRVSGPCIHAQGRGKWADVSGCIPRFWTDAYLAEYEELVTRMAARYDADPQIRTVANCAVAVLYCEPFLLGINDRQLDEFYHAGLNQDSYRHALRESTADLVAAFDRTRVDVYLHNAWQYITRTETGECCVLRSSWPAERAEHQRLRDRYGDQIVVTYHGWDSGDYSTYSGPPRAAPSFTAYLHTIEPPKGVQSGYAQESGGVRAQLATAVRMGFCWHERIGWRDFDNPDRGGNQPRLSKAELARFDRRLERNC